VRQKLNQEEAEQAQQAQQEEEQEEEERGGKRRKEEERGGKRRKEKERGRVIPHGLSPSRSLDSCGGLVLPPGDRRASPHDNFNDRTLPSSSMAFHGVPWRSMAILNLFQQFIAN